LLQAHWAEKKWVWVCDKKEGYVPATIQSENGDQLEIQFEDNSVKISRLTSRKKP
jgi:hypothetical protein